MKRNKLFTTTMALTMLFVAGTVFAQPGSGRGNGQGHCKGSGPDGERPHRMWENLNLNDKQKEELKKLHDEMQEVRKKHIEAVKTVRDKIKTELLKKKSSQNVLYGYAGELGELHKQMTKERGDHLLKVKKVLTPEQFKQIVEHEGRGFRKNGSCHGSPKDCQSKGKGCCKGGAGKGNGSFNRSDCPRLNKNVD